MQIGFKYHNCRGFGRLYDYAYKHNHMITKKSKQRVKTPKFIGEFLKRDFLMRVQMKPLQNVTV